MSLSVYPGPMFSGKTTRLLQEIGRFSSITEGNHALLINSVKDSRDIANVISSHSPFYKGLSSKIDVVSAENLSDVNIEKYIVIGIDECNFFSDLYETVKLWLKKGKHIICVGLDSDFRMDKFGQISDLLHLADKFEKLSAICCVCLDKIIKEGGIVTPDRTTPAPFTMRKTISSSVEEIGGSDKYQAVCRNCHPYY
jgi:thymidine kinase